ncbi:MAG: mannanase [Amphiplicatus sp.]
MSVGALKRAVGRCLMALIGTLCAAAAGAEETQRPPAGFVAVEGMRFVVDGEPYRFAGVNLWYAAYLGAPAEYGDRERLKAELDHLQALGATNLRILGASEESPFKRSLSETFRNRSESYNETLLQGLDYALAEMEKRGMRAVIFLNNFWEWSGGMGTYLYWTNGGTFVDLGDPAHPWPAFPNFTAQFYESAPANALYRDYIRAVITRTNTVTGRRYIDDPTIMAWQLANEPRPAFDARDDGPRMAAFHAWVRETAAYIKSLDPNHLVSTGNEGLMGCNESEHCFLGAHAPPEVDYLTFHIWPRNWSWYDPTDPEETFERTIERTKDYMRRHVEYARRLGKPVVLEEFGLDRDGEALAPGTPTTYRDAYLRRVFEAVEADARAGGPFAGTNIWSWGGAGRAQHDDFEWRRGDTRFTGDPPQEPQGRNSIFDVDESTLALIKAHAARLGMSEQASSAR